MIHMTQVQSGVAKFIDRDLAPSLSGWDRVIVGAAGGLLAARLPEVLTRYAYKPLVAAMNLYDAETDTVDVDTMYQAVLPYMGTEPMPVKIPLLGITMKIGRKEIDTLYAYMKEGA